MSLPDPTLRVLAPIAMRAQDDRADSGDGQRVDAALHVSEARLLALISISSTYAVYRMSPEWQEMRRLEGGGFLPDTDHPSTDWLETYIHADDQRRVMDAVHEAVRTRCMFEVEHRVRRADGTLGWTLSRAVPILGAGGEIREWIGAASDVTVRRQAEVALRRVHEDLERVNTRLRTELGAREQADELRSDLLRMLSTAQEDERARVARVLHDSVGQLLTTLSLAFKTVADAGGLPPSSAASLADARRVAEALAREVHGLAVHLRPTVLDDFGLASALTQLVAEWMRRTGVRAECQTVGLGALRLSSELETTVYRVVQEALANIARHAQASFASVVATRADGYVGVLIEDDGVGFDPEAMPPDRYGVRGMRERATQVGGELEVESAPGAGTTILLRIPRQADESGEA